MQNFRLQIKIQQTYYSDKGRAFLATCATDNRPLLMIASLQIY